MPVLSEQFIVEIWGHYFCIMNVWVEPRYQHEDDVWAMGVKYLPIQRLSFFAIILCVLTTITDSLLFLIYLWSLIFGVERDILSAESWTIEESMVEVL